MTTLLALLVVVILLVIAPAHGQIAFISIPSNGTVLPAGQPFGVTMDVTPSPGTVILSCDQGDNSSAEVPNSGVEILFTPNANQQGACTLIGFNQGPTAISNVFITLVGDEPPPPVVLDLSNFNFASYLTITGQVFSAPYTSLLSG